MWRTRSGLELPCFQLVQAAVIAIAMSLGPGAGAAEPAAAKRPPLANLTHCALPTWPAESLRRNESGKVALKFLIDDEGRVLEALVKRSSGFKLLDEAALAGIGKCSFAPAQYQGRPIGGWTSLEYAWTLAGPEEVQRDSERLASYRSAALAGNLDATVQLALMFDGHSTLLRNHDYALKLLRSVAARGHAQAEYELANALRSSPAAKNAAALAATDAEVVKWLGNAATHGNAAAQFEMASRYRSGRGVPRDPVQAAALFRLAADQGHATAQFGLGQMLATGNGVERNTAAAAALYRKAAEAGDNEAQLALGMACLNGLGVAKDAGEAFAWFSKAAADRHTRAEAALASLYLDGNGVTADSAEALKLLRRAARGGNIEAMGTLGKLLTAGTRVPAEPVEGEQWLRKAAGWSTRPANEAL